MIPRGQIDAVGVVLQPLRFSVDDAEAILVGITILDVIEEEVDAELLGAVPGMILQQFKSMKHCPQLKCKVLT